MKKRKLGKSSLKVSTLGLGCMNMTRPHGLPLAAFRFTFYWPVAKTWEWEGEDFAVQLIGSHDQS